MALNLYIPSTEFTSIPAGLPDREKWQLLQEVCIVDSKNPKIINMSKALWTLSLSDPVRFFKLTLAMTRDLIEYVSDIKQFGHEDIAGVTRYPELDDAIEAYRRGKDDCDAKARLFVAICLAAGFKARLWPLWKHGVLQHVAAEVQFQGKWYHAETILSRARFGEMHTDVPKEPNGIWKMS